MMEHAYQNQYWILTQRELKVVTMGQNATSGCHRSISIPLENIIRLLYHDSFLRMISDQRDVVKGTIRTSSSSSSNAPAAATTAIATVAVVPMQRGGGGGGTTTTTGTLSCVSITERMKQAKKLYDQGLISLGEYETKRHDILTGV
jgi:hypothetical protein